MSSDFQRLSYDLQTTSNNLCAGIEIHDIWDINSI